MKKTLLICIPVILITLLLFTSCKSNEESKDVSMWEVFSDIEEHLTPALKELSSTIPPGDLTPVECLRQAPETLVGTHISLSLTDISEKDIVVYRFRASDRQLVIKYSRSSSTGFSLFITISSKLSKSFGCPERNSGSLCSLASCLRIFSYSSYICFDFSSSSYHKSRHIFKMDFLYTFVSVSKSYMLKFSASLGKPL